MTLRPIGPQIFVLLALVFWGCSAEPSGFGRVVLEHWARYPQMQQQDLYKLAFQAALGNEHLMSDTAMVRRYLLEELESVRPSNDEPLCEEINVEGTLVRVNLRRFKAEGLDPEVLLGAMVRTGSTFIPSEQLLETFLGEIRHLSLEERIPVTLGELLPYLEQQRAAGFPPVHHSAEYAQQYHPAYRVVLAAYLPPSTAR